MRFLAVDFDGVLGVQGEVVFPENEPLVLYGENISGKSNVINALRYCLNPPQGRRPSGYSEDKLPRKGEMLVEPLENGSVTIYFAQGDELFKLEHRFSRTSSGVNRKEALYITEGEVPSEHHLEALEDIDWGNRDETGVRSIDDKLNEKRVYPEILDVLIAPSNIANFAEAVSGDIIDVPELIEREIERRRKRSEWYEEKLTMLKNVCEREEDTLSGELQDLKQEFLGHDFEAAGLSDDEAEARFDDGVEGLEEFRDTVSEEHRELPDVQQRVQEISTLVDRIQEQNKLVVAAEDALKDKDKLVEWVTQQPEFEEAAETVREWRGVLENLPTKDNIDNIMSFSQPDTGGFDFGLLKEGEKIKGRFETFAEMREKVKEADGIRDKHDVPKERLEERRNELNRLIDSLDDPIEKPDGIESVLFVDEDQAKVGVKEDDVEALDENPSYTNVSNTPQVVRTEAGSDSTEPVEEYRESVKEVRDEIESAIAALDDARNLLAEFRGYVPEQLKEEQESLETKARYRKDKIGDTRDDWNGVYANLCEGFDDIGEKETGFETVEEVEQTAEVIQEAVDNARDSIRTDLEGELAEVADIAVPDEIDKESLEELVASLEEKQDELETARDELDDLESWIDKNLDDVEEIDEKLETVTVSRDVAAIGSLVFNEVKQNSDITEIVDEIAESIESNVRATYNHIFAGERLEFAHVGDGDFRCTLNGNEITHPSGSQRAVISFGIMVSLATSFDLPILLDEAADRFDYIRLSQFLDFIGEITKDQGIQTCLVICKSKDIEEHAEVRDRMAESEVYLLQRLNEVENQVKAADIDSIIDST